MYRSEMFSSSHFWHQYCGTGTETLVFVCCLLFFTDEMRKVWSNHGTFVFYLVYNLYLCRFTEVLELFITLAEKYFIRAIFTKDPKLSFCQLINKAAEEMKPCPNRVRVNFFALAYLTLAGKLSCVVSSLSLFDQLAR